VAISPQVVVRTPDEFYELIMSEIRKQFVRDPTVLESPQAKRTAHAIRRGVDMGFGIVPFSEE